MRRRPARVAPTFSIELSATDKAPETKRDEKDVTRKEAEHLIVDLDAGTLDSPYIATSSSGHFPGEEAKAAPKERRKFFRVDESNLFVFVNDREDSNEDHGGTPLEGLATTARQESNLWMNDCVSPATAPVSSHSDPFSSSRPLFDGGEDQVVLPPKRGMSGMGLPRKSASEPDLLFGFGRKGKEKGSNSPSPLLPPIPETENIKFEDLEMLEHLGSGQQGSVRLVRHKGRNFALKKICVSDALDRSQADVERQARKNGIVRELQMVANGKKRSPYVVALHNAFFRKDSDRGNLHILMEKMSYSVEDIKLMIEKLPPSEVRATTQRCFGNHLQGARIESRITPMYFTMANEVADSKATPFPEIVLALIANDALQGLRHFEKVLKMVHTDIKPANLMFSETHELVKIADFGCSQVLRGDNTVQVNNVLLGTKLYMSPERAEACYGGLGGSFYANADLWSIGIMLLELASGVHPCEPFKEEYWDFAHLLTWKNFVKPESTNSLFCDFVQKCLVVDPAQRPSAEQLLNHDFLAKYRNTPRRKLQLFINSVRKQSETYERKAVQKTMAGRMMTAANTVDRDKAKKESQKAWQGFKKGVNMGVTPDLTDEGQFPSLGAA